MNKYEKRVVALVIGFALAASGLPWAIGVIREWRVADELQADDSVLASRVKKAIQARFNPDTPLGFGRPSPNQMVSTILSRAFELDYPLKAPDCLRKISILREIGEVGGPVYRERVNGTLKSLRCHYLLAVLTAKHHPESAKVILAAVSEKPVEMSGLLLRIPLQSQQFVLRLSKGIFFNETPPWRVERYVPKEKGVETPSPNTEVSIRVQGTVTTNPVLQITLGTEKSSLIIDNPSEAGVMILLLQRDLYGSKEHIVFFRLPPRSWQAVRRPWEIPAEQLPWQTPPTTPVRAVTIAAIEWNEQEEENRLWSPASEKTGDSGNRLLGYHSFRIQEEPKPECYLYSVGGQNRYSFERVVYR